MYGVLHFRQTVIDFTPIRRQRVSFLVTSHISVRNGQLMCIHEEEDGKLTGRWIIAVVTHILREHPALQSSHLIISFRLKRIAKTTITSPT